jgi:hypothetical protein
MQRCLLRRRLLSPKLLLMLLQHLLLPLLVLLMLLSSTACRAPVAHLAYGSPRLSASAMICSNDANSSSWRLQPAAAQHAERQGVATSEEYTRMLAEVPCA